MMFKSVFFFLISSIPFAWCICKLEVTNVVYDNQFGKLGLYRSNVLLQLICTEVKTADKVEFKVMKEAGTNDDELFKAHSLSRSKLDHEYPQNDHAWEFHTMLTDLLEGKSSDVKLYCTCDGIPSSKETILVERPCEPSVCGLSTTLLESVCYGTTVKAQQTTYSSQVKKIMENQKWNRNPFSPKNDYYCDDCEDKCEDTQASRPFTDSNIERLFAQVSLTQFPISITDNDKFCSYKEYMAVHQSDATPPPKGDHPCANESAYNGKGCYWEAYCMQFRYYGDKSVDRNGKNCLTWSGSGSWRRQHMTYGIGDHNKCRMPQNGGVNQPWCYTGIWAANWETCYWYQCTDADEYVWQKPKAQTVKINYWNPFPLRLEWTNIESPTDFISQKVYVGGVYYVTMDFIIIPNNRKCPVGNFEDSDMDCYIYSWEKPVNGRLGTTLISKRLESIKSTNCEDFWEVKLTDVVSDKINMIGCLYRFKKHQWDNRDTNEVPKLSSHKVEFYVVNVKDRGLPQYQTNDPQQMLVDCSIDDDFLKAATDPKPHIDCQIQRLTKQGYCRCTFTTCTPFKRESVVTYRVALSANSTLPPTTPAATTIASKREELTPPRRAPVVATTEASIGSETQGESSTFPAWAIGILILFVIGLTAVAMFFIISASKDKKKKKGRKDDGGYSSETAAASTNEGEGKSISAAGAPGDNL